MSNCFFLDEKPKIVENLLKKMKIFLYKIHIPVLKFYITGVRMSA